MEMIRLIIGSILLVAGFVFFVLQILGVFKMKYVLNRMHATAMGDTLGLGLCMLGLIFISGFNFVSFKLLLVLVFMWFSSPVSSHLIAKLEVRTPGGEEFYGEVEK